MSSDIRPVLFIAILGICGWLIFQWPSFVERQNNIALAEQTQLAERTENINSAGGDINSSSSSSYDAGKKKIKINTPLFAGEISTEGASIVNLDLKKYTKSLDDDSPDQILSDSGELFLVFQNGLLGDKNLELPNHLNLYKSLQDSYILDGNQDELKVPFIFENDNVKITKTYTFYNNSYKIDLNLRVENKTDKSFGVTYYNQFVRNDYKPKALTYNFVGGVWWDKANDYEKLSFSDMEDKAFKIAVGGWVGMMRHYFVSALIPNPNQNNAYFSKSFTNSFNQERFVAGVKSPVNQVNANDTLELDDKLYIGPKIAKNLKKVAPGLELTVDYGIFSPIAELIYWLLSHIHDIVKNWGLSVILLTVLIKVLLFPLAHAGFKSMARMKLLAPKLQSLRANYGHDKMILQKKIMEFYKSNKVNPLGGCLPMLAQIPIFMSLYWVVLEAVELRQAPFVFWINDLSVMDPYFVLPVIMGLSMFLQQKLNPINVMDEMQRNIMKFLPLVFTVLFLWFPAALVLYWITNNCLSLAHQYYILQKITKENSNN